MFYILFFIIICRVILILDYKVIHIKLNTNNYCLLLLYINNFELTMLCNFFFTLGQWVVVSCQFSFLIFFKINFYYMYDSTNMSVVEIIHSVDYKIISHDHFVWWLRCCLLWFLCFKFIFCPVCLKNNFKIFWGWYIFQVIFFFFENQTLILPHSKR